MKHDNIPENSIKNIQFQFFFLHNFFLKRLEIFSHGGYGPLEHFDNIIRLFGGTMILNSSILSFQALQATIKIVTQRNFFKNVKNIS